jgi:hypothetical protein
MSNPFYLSWQPPQGLGAPCRGKVFTTGVKWYPSRLGWLGFIGILHSQVNVQFEFRHFVVQRFGLRQKVVVPSVCLVLSKYLFGQWRCSSAIVLWAFRFEWGNEFSLSFSHSRNYFLRLVPKFSPIVAAQNVPLAQSSLMKFQQLKSSRDYLRFLLIGGLM